MRERQERQRLHLQGPMSTAGATKAHTARQAQSRLKALARMEPVAAAVEDTSLAFDFPDPDGLRPPLIVLEDVAVG